MESAESINNDLKLPYEAPAIEELGTLAKLTLGNDLNAEGDTFLGEPAPGGFS